MDLSPEQGRKLLPAPRQDLIRGPSQIIGEFALTDSSGILLFKNNNAIFIAPFSNDGSELGYRRATADDAVTANFLSNPAPTGLRSTFLHSNYQHERFINVDQSNQSIVVDEKIIVKWQLVAKSSHGTTKELLLTRNKFKHLPSLLGHLHWNELLLATINAFIPSTTDGWTWCVDKAATNDSGTWVNNLALLTKEMHRCLDGSTHGDFHVGQILKESTNDQLWVIDFEGDPLADSTTESDVIDDVARMCASFFHVGAIAIKYGADTEAVKSWILNAESKFLNGYFVGTSFDLSELHRKMRMSENRELTYADKFLPIWKYAPEFAIKYMKSLNYGSN